MLLKFVAALLIGVLWGTLAQSQINLQALSVLGVPIDMNTRLQVTLHDLWNFGPVYAVIFGGSFVASQAVALLITRFVGAAFRTALCTVGGAVGLWVTFLVVDMIAPMPTLIAATRGAGGTLLMLAGAAFAGHVFSRTTSKAATSKGASSISALGAAALFALAAWLPAQPAQAQGKTAYQVNTFVDNLQNPWGMAFLPDGRALVTEKAGRLRLIQADGKLNPQPVQGVPQVYFGGQAGLFDVLPATDFTQSRRIFLSYACGTRAANHLCVSSAVLGEGTLTQVKEIFRSQGAKSGNAHYGGRMDWLPDNTLIITLGDGYDYREEAQNLGNHLGKIVRINADGTVPANNPFAKQAGAKPEIYSLGHRNVQGLVYDPVGKRLLAHEHGPRGGDEINVIEPGKNYGWPKATYGIDYSGAQISPFKTFEGTEQPAIYWVPSIAPSGMAVYQGDLFPAWRGDVLVGALRAMQVSRVTVTGNKGIEKEVLFKEVGERIRDVRVGPDGAVYLLTDNPDGRVLKVTPK
ncbi:PQQ-dependent sugar dehydrogenase [Limnobacter sp.]|uniref:PQQ-dependent sugar dehydrogenase n=1 Tax=Limnobacter sp. TaxID=2003368 RepID=UPI00351101D0